MALRPPVTGAEEYLAAILGELRALRVLLAGDGAGGPTPPADGPAPSPTKRTRTRSRTTATG